MHGEWICAKIAYSLKDFQEQLMTFKQMESFCSGLPRLWANIFPLWFFPKISVCLALNLQFSFFFLDISWYFPLPLKKWDQRDLKSCNFPNLEAASKRGVCQPVERIVTEFGLRCQPGFFMRYLFFPRQASLEHQALLVLF